MGVAVEVWVGDIHEKVIPSDSFILKSVDHSAYVRGRKVNVPLGLSQPTFVINRKGKSDSKRRHDTPMSYDIDDITTDATIVTNIEEQEVSYQKRQSILRGHIASLSIGCSINIINKWSRRSSVKVVTTGATRVACLKGATGNRKKMALSDGLKIRSAFGDAGLPEKGRHILMPTQWADDILEWVSDNPTSELVKNGVVKIGDDGVITHYFGMQVWIRPASYIGYFVNNLLKMPEFETKDHELEDGEKVTKTIAKDVPVNAKMFAMAWHEESTTRAVGAIDLMATPVASSYGTEVTASMMFGGGVFFDDAGVVLLVEGESS
jgi:hypothetical protein